MEVHLTLTRSQIVRMELATKGYAPESEFELQATDSTEDLDLVVYHVRHSINPDGSGYSASTHTGEMISRYTSVV